MNYIVSAKSVISLKSILIIGCLFLTSLFSFAGNAEKNIYLVRHAEKQSDGTGDPGLTAQGKQRAALLAQRLLGKNITAIYSSDYQRTKQTAKPLAKQLNIEVTVYDPRKLKEFAEAIKTYKGNILIVGHSNTTPALAYYLGGKAFGDIDESEYDRLYQLQVTDDQIKSTLLRLEPVKQYADLKAVQINTDRFTSAQNTYQMSFRGKPVGKAVHSIKSRDNSFELYEKTVIESFNIDADIKLSISKKNLQPISMTMTGLMGKPVEIFLKWKEHKVSGHSLQARAAYKPQGQIEIERQLSPYSVERSSVLMLAHLFDLKPSQTNTFQWYNGYDDSTKTIEASYLGDKKITVPAGTFETQMIEFLGGAPSQIYYVSKEEKPKVIKMEIIASPWQYELTETKSL